MASNSNKIEHHNSKTYETIVIEDDTDGGNARAIPIAMQGESDTHWWRETGKCNKWIVFSVIASVITVGIIILFIVVYSKKKE